MPIPFKNKWIRIESASTKLYPSTLPSLSKRFLWKCFCEVCVLAEILLSCSAWAKTGNKEIGKRSIGKMVPICSHILIGVRHSHFPYQSTSQYISYRLYIVVIHDSACAECRVFFLLQQLDSNMSQLQFWVEASGTWQQEMARLIKAQ